MTRDETLEFRLLGPLEVLAGGRPIALGLRQRTLLVLLLLRANEVASRDRLIDDLWGEHPPAAAPNALAAIVARLRRALPGDVLVTSPGGYELRIDRQQLDLHRFERLVEEGTESLAAGDPVRAAEQLREALSIWRGPALADVEYEAFAQPVIVRLEELRLIALESRTDADLALGRHADLVGELQSLVLEHPLRERLRGQLMLALYRSGRQAEALEVYREGRHVLVEELGIDPSPPLQELERAILRQDPILGAPETDSVGPQPARAILIAAQSEATLDALLALAAPLGARSGRELIMLVLAGEDRSLADATRLAHDRRDALAQDAPAVRAAAFVSATPGEDIVRLASEQNVDLLLVDPLGRLSDDLAGELTSVLERAPCDVGVLVPRRGRLPTVGPDQPVIVPFGGAEHEWAAMEIGAWIASAGDAPLKLAGTTADPETGRRDASRLLATASLVLQQAAGIAAEPMLVRPGAEAVVEAGRGAGVIVVGLPERWRQQGLEGARLDVVKHARSPVLLVRGGVRPGGLAPSESLTRYTWTIASASGS
jgi:DNA-binding SARP family transcriptional activator